MYQFFLDGVLLPVTPSSMTLKVANQNDTITLINEGEVSVLKRPGLSKISFEALLPNRKYSFAQYQSGFQSAQYFLSLLENLKTGCAPFMFEVIRMDDRGTVLIEARCMQVSLEAYELLEDADRHGTDVLAKIDLRQWRACKTARVEFQQAEDGTVAEVTEQRETTTAPAAPVYTVQPGDNLWEIARIKLGDGMRMSEIYRLNQDTIEAEAKKHRLASSSNGHWIYPGTVLMLPG